jgi:hypothetical protein
MDESQRVTFRFARDTEVHYVDRLPSVGDRVTHQHELWVVDRVDEDLVGALVVCELPDHGRPSVVRLVESVV